MHVLYMAYPLNLTVLARDYTKLYTCKPVILIVHQNPIIHKNTVQKYVKVLLTTKFYCYKLYVYTGRKIKKITSCPTTGQILVFYYSTSQHSIKPAYVLKQ